MEIYSGKRHWRAFWPDLVKLKFDFSTTQQSHSLGIPRVAPLTEVSGVTPKDCHCHVAIMKKCKQPKCPSLRE